MDSTKNTNGNFELAGCVILYHPDKEVVRNISSLSMLDKVYVIDNTEGKINENGEAIRRFSNVHFYHDFDNQGIGKRLNQVCNLAIGDGFIFLLTMDQDSHFEPEVLSKYFSCIKDNISDKAIAMFGVSIIKEFENPDFCSSSLVDFLITSGSIINLSLYQELGKFDERLFIDYVDTEYCLRIKEKKYKCLKFHNILLDHKLGNSIERRSYKNFKFSPRIIHAPSRIFFMVRNYFYLKKKYKSKFPAELRQLGNDLKVRIKNNFLYGDSRIAVLSNVIKGFVAYLRNR